MISTTTSTSSRTTSSRPHPIMVFTHRSWRTSCPSLSGFKLFRRIRRWLHWRGASRVGTDALGVVQPERSTSAMYVAPIVCHQIIRSVVFRNVSGMRPKRRKGASEWPCRRFTLGCWRCCSAFASCNIGVNQLRSERRRHGASVMSNATSVERS